MKLNCVLFFLLCSAFVFSQKTISDTKKAFYNCTTSECKITASIAITEQYLEIDQIENAQKWLDYSKKMLLKYPNEKLQYNSYSLQSELFYYMGLYQFGLHESQKAIELGNKLKDSLFISNSYLLEGINWYEMENIKKAEISFHQAKKYFPDIIPSTYIRYKIDKEYIYNNLAQLKIKTNELDSSYFYNKKAYKFAKKSNNYRCTANVELIFGEMFLKRNKQDSAQFYFDKSINTALGAEIYDVALLGYANLQKCFSTQIHKVNHYFQTGQDLIKTHNINPAFQKLFYSQSLIVFQSLKDEKLVLETQEKLLSIDKNIYQNGNIYIQNITDQYINSENKLLQSKINELDKQKNITILQLLTALFFGLILILIIIIFKRKNRLQKLILDQKNEISKDLHDDIGSELSSILINTNLLKNYDPNDKQKVLIDKISNTSAEISQRLSAFIWSLNTDNNSVQNFCEYVKLYAYKFMEGTEIKLIFSEETAGIATKILNGNARKNLFFAIKEILNNAVKHSGATKIIIYISSADKKTILITIEDNGKGLQGENKFGNGLVNIKKRITNLKGDIKICNSNGLKIRIKVPL